jgi:hypothetical protein
MTPPSRKSRPSAISSIGLTGAPSSAAATAPPAASQQTDDTRRHDAETPQRRTVTTPRRQDASTPTGHDAATPEHRDAETSGRQDVATQRGHGAGAERRRDVVTVADGSVAFTVRLTADEALDLDELQLEFRRALRLRVDKASILRALLSLAADDPELRDRIADRLRQR